MTNLIVPGTHRRVIRKPETHHARLGEQVTAGLASMRTPEELYTDRPNRPHHGLFQTHLSLGYVTVFGPVH